MKIMGALINPLFQNGARMIAAGMCTEEQYVAGKIELLDRIARYHESKSGTTITSLSTRVVSTHQWDDSGLVDVGNSPDQTARQEYDKFLSWNHSQYLPKMKSTRVLGAIDEEGQPRDPIYAIGAVVEKGVNLPSGRNHAEYVDVILLSSWMTTGTTSQGWRIWVLDNSALT